MHAVSLLYAITKVKVNNLLACLDQLLAGVVFPLWRGHRLTEPIEGSNICKHNLFNKGYLGGGVNAVGRLINRVDSFKAVQASQRGLNS